jgi:hypothetical protein
MLVTEFRASRSFGNPGTTSGKSISPTLVACQCFSRSVQWVLNKGGPGVKIANVEVRESYKR